MRVLRNANTEHYAEHPEELKAFLSSCGNRSATGLHLGGARTRPASTRARGLPGWPGRRGIDELVPPGLVARMVAEAEAALGAPPAPQLAAALPPSVVAPLRIRSLPREPLTSHR